jgi:hypothetical protein
MIEKLPAACYANGVLPLMQQAGVEAFLVYVRTMVEFLGIHPDRRDRAATDILPRWSPGGDPAARARLEGYWSTASAHVMHFGQLRTKQDDNTWVSVPVDESALEAIANDVLAVWDEFADAVASADLMGSLRVPKRGNFRLWDADGTSQR